MRTSIETAIICGVCGVTRKESNHWILVARTGHNLVFRPLSLPTDEMELRSDSRWAVCGDEHAAKVLSDWCHELRQVKAMAAVADED